MKIDDVIKVEELPFNSITLVYRGVLKCHAASVILNSKEDFIWACKSMERTIYPEEEV